jgi:hypothetical protein
VRVRRGSRTPKWLTSEIEVDADVNAFCGSIASGARSP